MEGILQANFTPKGRFASFLFYFNSPGPVLLLLKGIIKQKDASG